MKKVNLQRMNLKQWLRNSTWGEVFSQDEEGRARGSIIMSGVMGTIYNAFITGTFYTGFLLALGIDIVNIGVISTISLITGFFNIFSPMFLNRFKSRRKLLIITRLIYHTVNILGVTILPFLPLSTDGKIAMLCIFVFIAGSIANITSPGFSAWHIVYLGNNQMRTKYLSLQMVINGTVQAVAVLLSGQLATFVTSFGAELEITFIVILRLVGFVLAMVEIFFLVRPKEPEYHNSETGTSLIAIVRDPFRYKIFLMTVLIVFVWNFAAYLSSSAFSAYVLGTLKITYSEITIIDSLYCVFLFLLIPFWRKYLANHSMFKVLIFNMALYGMGWWIALFFTKENAFVLFPVLRIAQHIIGTGLNLTFGNLPWVHMPVKDRTTCLAFYSLMANIFALLGQICGTAFIAATEDMTFDLMFLRIDSVQMLLLIQSLITLVIVGYICVMRKKLEAPGDETIE